ncbi:MAG: pyruvate formate lyase-activating protein [Clostridia bacterium]|nr:pyruvate formate lyase-activating protein [Clostridia bacterium]
MKGYVHSLQSMGTLDGPGVRAVLFTEGCPLRCAYCHNPDTWECRAEDAVEHTEIAERVLRLYPYIKNGGVTFSGGEPCAQAKFVCEVAKILRAKGLHIAIDTCGDIDNSDVDELLGVTDLVLLDVKFTTEADYAKYCGGSLERTMRFLDKLERLGKDVWIRHVVVPNLNDNEEDVSRLAELLRGYKCIKKVDFLPFKTLCREKYQALGISFPLANTRQMDKNRLDELYKGFEGEFLKNY